MQGLDDAKPIIQATPVSLSARAFEPLAAAMRIAAPAKRHKSGTMVGLGSFLSITSADSGGHPPNGTLSGIAQTGTKMLGNVLHDLHVVGAGTQPMKRLSCILLCISYMNRAAS